MSKVRINSIEDFVNIYNGFLNLSVREKEVLCIFIKITLMINSINGPINAFSTEMRKYASDKLSFDGTSINNYINMLHKKGVIIKLDDVGKYKIRNFLIPEKHKRIEFRLDQSLFENNENFINERIGMVEFFNTK